MIRFDGVIGPTWRESTPWWPPEPSSPSGAPNVVVIVLDDVGFAQLGCYGSDIETPHLDRLASEGVRLSRFHTTSLCSPTRACLLTGRNHHSVGMGRVADLAIGYPGYWGRIDRTNGFLSEMLAATGYVPVAVGKWHLTPEDETHMAAPRDTWPTGRGFQRWYGFHGGETHQFVPSLFEDNHSVQPPAGGGYHLSEDLADRAIRYLADIRSVSAQPFFLYFATGACHSPHHAPAEWIARYHGRFDAGWDAWREQAFARQLDLGVVPSYARLSPRPHWVPAWDSLEPEDQRVASRFMECFAAFLSHADAQIGRLLAFLDDLGEADDTIVIALSDNGASAEGGAQGSINDARLWNGAPAGRRELQARVDELGGPTAHNNYPWGWTLAGNTPFRRWKREVHEGGIADPCIIRWKGGSVQEGAVRHQMTHAIDVAPTILELLGVDAPEELGGVAQRPLEGTSFAYLLRDGGADAPERHTKQHFEMFGSRGIYHDGWKAVTFKPLGPMYDDGLDPDAPFEDDVWELYDVRADPTECVDLAAEHPERLAELVELWWEEARRFNVLPLDNRPVAALFAPRRGPDERQQHTYWPGAALIPETVALDLKNRSHRITAHAEGTSGTILALGTALGGWAVQLFDGHLRYVHNHLGRDRHVIASTERLPAGRHLVEAAISAPGDFSGLVALYVDGDEVARGTIPRLTAVRHSITGGGVTCGWEQGPSIGDDYVAPFSFDGELGPVTVSVSGAEHRDPDAMLESILAEQ